MVVFSMNSKRIRRPSVRLWEVGDLPAAFTCGISKLNNGSTRQKKWKNDFSDLVQESEYLQFATKGQPEYITLVPGVFPRIFEDNQHNSENRDPNSSRLVSQFAISDDEVKSKSKLDFGTITRRPRVMKRKRRNLNSISSLYCPWKPKHGWEISNSEIEKGNKWNQVVGCTSDAGFSTYHVNDFKDSLENETSAASKEACNDEIDGMDFGMKIVQSPNETWSEAAWSEEDTSFPQSTCGHNNKVSSDGDVNSVTEWLEELGFGKFADLFELHEVDKEALPLLTFEDLKDMGIDAVGPRRKLFTAIQHLKKSTQSMDPMNPVSMCLY